jgi:F0F1-type ATP synthase assembly protein I
MKEEQKSKLKSWQEKQSEAYRVYIKTSAVGLEVGLSIGVGALLGYFFDRYFAYSPYGLLIGTLIGVLAAGKRLWSFAKDYLKKDGSSDE